MNTSDIIALQLNVDWINIKSMKYFFTIASYSDHRQDIFDNVFSPRNQKYCDKHGYKYIEIRKEHNPTPFRGNLTWNKISTIKDLIDSGKLPDGSIITNFDADMIILDDSIPIEPDENHSFAVAIDSGNTFCFGWTSFRINEWSRGLINNILSDELWNKWKNIATPHPGIPSRPPYPHILEFREQAAFYLLFGIKRHSWESFLTLPNNGINADMTYSAQYSVEDFNKHVQLFGPEYNCTIWPDESDTTFYINKCKKEDVKIRHLTGCDWNMYKNWI